MTLITFTLLIIAIISFFIFLLIFSIMMIVFTQVPYAPTPPSMIKKILEKTNIQKGQKVYDLGCGNGRFLFAAEKKEARVVGFELSLAAYLKAWMKKIILGSRAKIYFKNFYSADLSDADIVYNFLVGKVMLRLENKLQKELKKGAVVINYGFPFPNWEPYDVILPDPKNEKTATKVFFYKK